MMKKFLSILLTIALVMGICPVFAFAATVTMNTISFHVDTDFDAGLGGNVNIELSGSSSSYSGTLYLPGSADVANLKLAWEGDVTVTVNGTTYNSGEAPIPTTNGGSLTYKVNLGTSTPSVTIKMMKGSATVEGMFLTIDESYVDDEGTHTITAMLNDEYHEATCYGGISFDGVEYDMSIKGRGNWTWWNGGNAVDKKPFNITIYEDATVTDNVQYVDKKAVTFIEGVSAKKWSLLANYADSSLMRNKIGYDLACNLGIGLDSRYIDIWMNGEYIGNYLMTAKSDYNAPKGGYMLELDNNLDREDPYFNLDGLVAAGSSDNVITVKDIGKNAAQAGETPETIQAWMQEMLNAVMEPGDRYLDYVDVDSWAKLYILQEVCKNHDIICGSIFMHRDGLTADDKLIAGPVWDLDNTMGRIWFNDHSGISRDMQFTADGWYIDAISGQTSFLQYLAEHEDFMQRVYEIYNEYESAFQYMYDEIDELTPIIADSANMNFDVFPANQSQYNAQRYTSKTTRGTGTYSYVQIVTSTWDTYLTNLKNYLNARLSFIKDKLKLSAPTGGPITGNTTVYIRETDALTDTLTLTADCTADAYQWQFSADNVTWTNIKGATSKVYSALTKYTMNGAYYRCIIKKTGNTIAVSNVATVPTASRTYLDPVQITVGLDGHEHDCSSVVVTDATCISKGYTTHTCACGYSYIDEEVKKLGHNYENGICTRCNYQDPDYVMCEYEESASLSADTLVLYLGGTKVGEFTFSQSSTNWLIKNSSDKYLTISNKALSYTTSTSSATWTYSNGRFSKKSGYGTSATTYYLVYSDGQLTVSTNTTGSNATFAKKISTNIHLYGDWTTTKAPTCTKKGEQQRTCSRCNNVDIGEIKKLGHNFSTEWTVDLEPGCTTSGSKSHHCLNTGCTETSDVTSIDPAHKPGDWITDTDSTCYSVGSKHKECTVCHTTLETAEITKKQHNYSTDWTTDLAATCTTKGSKSHHCTNKGCTAKTDVTEIEMVAHNLGSWTQTKAATCTEKGQEKRTCSNCTYYETRDINALNHNFSTEWTTDLAATCTTKGSKSHHCLNSGCTEKSNVTEIEMIAHTPSNWILDKDSTCSVVGSQHKECTVCHKTLKTSEVTLKSHNLGNWTQTLAPTCTAKGQEKRTCSNCTYFETRDINALNHNFSTEWSTDLAATCTTKGSKSHHCLNSGCTEKSNVTEIEMIAHTPSNWILDKDSTCSVVGSQHKECTVCHKTLETSEVTMKSHNLGNWTQTLAPTCTAKGQEKRTCSNCTYFETRDINTINHNYSTEWTVDIEATTINVGSKSHHCLGTGCNAKSDVTEIDQLVLGAVSGGDTVTSADAILLLRHVLFPTNYSVNQSCDFNADGKEDSADAILLLRHSLFPTKYVLTNPLLTKD